MRRLIILLSFIFVLAPGIVAAKSIALIIGNDTYANLVDLDKARSDAAGYQSLFQSLGFDVTMRTDLTRPDMSFELATFFDRIAPGDTVAFVFAGHGWSDGNDNFLIPTDMRAAGSETLFARESFSLRNGANGIIDEITKRGAGLTLAIIDACRDNPFAATQGTRSVGLARGLAPVEAPTGTFVAFSAGAGQTALDSLSNTDPATYSVFTRHFLAELAKPQDLQSAFKRTQQLVNQDAAGVGHPQRPAYYDEVIGAACLLPDCGTAQVVVQPLPQNRNVEAAQAWEAFKNSNSVDALRLFAQQYSGTAYAALASERISQLGTPAVQPQPAEPAPRPAWCVNARTQTERAICANDELATLDLELEMSYKARRQSLSANQRDRLLSEQRRWLTARDTCGASLACLVQSYTTRLSALGN
ncbi:caspase family protein [Yoonia sp. F2084L]|uniref:caspase family protein n=1 Tax=Yoonia sp. F2084L TaxID=2926419 RepID=UPI001FF1EE5D|nr:caspase family protein [Yoonia sp. F2084L]MCK0097435.1 caspase family protein [Yoonia sp. F2084L]